MKSLSLLASVLALGVMLATGNADAASKRLGAGKSTGMQRQATPDKAPAAAPAASPSPAAAAAPQAKPKSSWMGPLAGIAAGLGIAALASHFGFGEQLASFLMIGLLVMAVMVVIGIVMRRRAAANAAGKATNGGLNYAAAGADAGQPNRGAYELSMPPSGSGSSTPAPTAGNIPAGFDAAGFVRNAKINFIRLQAANDAGNLDDLRDFTTPEMFAELRMNIVERAGAAQKTEVVTLDATVVDVAEEAARYVVSVRFHGSIREEEGASPQPADEIWNMVKPRDGSGGWVVAGIQQMQ